MAKNKGFSIIEIIITLAIITVIIAGIGKALALISRVYNSSAIKTQALTYLQGPIELIDGLKDDLFGCSCVLNGCVCTRASDGQTCTAAALYKSCWTQYPKDLNGQTRFYLEKIGGNWQLKPLVAGAKEAISGKYTFSREIKIENMKRNASGVLDPTGTIDYNTKKVTVTVEWDERGKINQSNLSIILTGWKNL
jgi:prepilin-type N-terminal cleavage/methylation domain-containing protein